MKIKNLISYEGSPPQGLSEARWGQEVLFLSLIRRGGGGVHRFEGYGDNNPHHYSYKMQRFLWENLRNSKED